MVMLLPANVRARKRLRPIMTNDESNPAQLGLDLAESHLDSCEVYSLDDIRSDLREMLDKVRDIGAENMWSGQEHRYQKAVFRELCRNLPDPEGEQLSFVFFEEIDRIERLMAA